MRFLFHISLLFLVALVALGYGIGIGVYRLWPYNELRVVKDEMSFVVADLRGSAKRLTARSNSQVLEGLAPLAPQDIFGDSAPQIALTEPADGLTLVVGSFDLGEVGHAALLLDPQGRLVHHWRLNEDTIQTAERREPRFKFPHGFEVLTDGSVIFSFDGGASMQRFDACSRPVWQRTGAFHHAISLTEDRTRGWVLLARDPQPEDPLDEGRRVTAVEFDTADGKTVRQVTVRDIIDANPQFDVFGARHVEETRAGYRWEKDPLHPNDVDPLPASMAAAFPQFEAGDLLMSFRSINLVVVVDPDDYKIRWFTFGLMRRQHDPDWQPDGTITVYDNNMHRDVSRIIRFDPATPHAAETLVDGSKLDFYSWIQGKHQLTRGGTAVLFSSPQQGRALEVGLDGKVLMELVNPLSDQPDRRYFVSEVLRLPADFFDPGALDGCD